MATEMHDTGNHANAWYRQSCHSPDSEPRDGGYGIGCSCTDQGVPHAGLPPIGMCSSQRTELVRWNEHVEGQELGTFFEWGGFRTGSPWERFTPVRCLRLCREKADQAIITGA